jgi:hypothetical protein
MVEICDHTNRTNVTLVSDLQSQKSAMLLDRINVLENALSEVEDKLLQAMKKNNWLCVEEAGVIINEALNPLL